MSNVNTPAMMAQSMAESLLRENKDLKEHNEHLVRETVKMAADVAAIQRAHDEQKLRLYTEICSIKALLTVQVQEGWKLVPVDLPQNHPMRSKMIEYAERIAAGQSILYADMWADIVANAPAFPQQEGSQCNCNTFAPYHSPRRCMR